MMDWIHTLPIYVTVPMGAIATLIAGLVAYHVYLLVRFPGEASVQWSSLPYLGHAVELGERPVEFLQDLARGGEEIVGVILAGHRVFFVMDAFSAPLVFKNNADYGQEEFHNQVLGSFFGVSDHTIHNHGFDNDMMRRWYTTYLLGDKSLSILTARMQDEIRRGINGVHDGVQSLCECMGRFIFKASLAAILKSEAAADPLLFEAFNNFDAVMPLLLAGVPSSMFPDFEKNRNILAQACATYTSGLSELMERRWVYLTGLEQEGKMKPGDAARTQLAILWASVGNTMPGTFWMIYYLLTNPSCMQKVRQEIERVVPNFVERCRQEQDITFEELQQMVYLDACITEALRLSSGSLIMRSFYRSASVTLASGRTYKFRKGDRIALCPPVLHRDEEIYPNAQQYLPERWMLPECDPKSGIPYELADRINAAQGKIPLYKGGKEVPSSSVFLAFGAGVSHCPGRRFARSELKCLLVYILSRLEISLTDRDCPPPRFLSTRAGIGIFPPAHDILVDVKVVH